MDMYTYMGMYSILITNNQHTYFNLILKSVPFFYPLCFANTLMMGSCMYKSQRIHTKGTSDKPLSNERLNNFLKTRSWSTDLTHCLPSANTFISVIGWTFFCINSFQNLELKVPPRWRNRAFASLWGIGVRSTVRTDLSLKNWQWQFYW